MLFPPRVCTSRNHHGLQHSTLSPFHIWTQSITKSKPFHQALTAHWGEQNNKVLPTPPILVLMLLYFAFLRSRLSCIKLENKWTIFNSWTKWKSWKFSFSRNARIREAGIEQATVATRCLGANSPEPRRRAVTEWHVITQKTSSYITVSTWLPGLIVGPCPSEERLCCTTGGLAASHSSKDPPSLAYWLFASPQLISVRWCCRGRAKHKNSSISYDLSVYIFIHLFP